MRITNWDYTPLTSDEKIEGLTLEERYGKASFCGYKTKDWGKSIAEFVLLEKESLGEASLALGQYVQANDSQAALDHFLKAAKAGIAEGAWGAACILGHEHIAQIKGKDKSWYELCLQAALGGCGDAMNELGNYYNRINDYIGAYYWYQLAEFYECPGSVGSAARIVEKYLRAGSPALSQSIDGVRPNDVKNTISIFRCMTQQDALDQKRMDSFVRAAMEDENEIMGLFIGHFFEQVAKMDGNARMGYKLAAHNHSIIGMKCYGDMLYHGIGGDEEKDKAISWYQDAAEKGEKTACFIMGELLQILDNKLSAYWFSSAIRRGYTPALERMLQVLE